MSRNFSAAALEAMFGDSTDEVFLVFVTVNEDSLPAPLRFINDVVEQTRLGDLYLPVRFGLGIPSEEEGTLSRVTLVMDNVSDVIGDAILAATSRPKMTLEIVLASDIDADPPEAGPVTYELESASFDAAQVQATLVWSDVVQRRHPAHGYFPGDVPGIF